MKNPSSLHTLAARLERLSTGSFWTDFWRSKRRVVIRGMLVGVIIHLFLVYHPTRISSWAENAALDWAMKNDSVHPRLSDPAFVFINIDDQTMKAWPQVPYVPRDKLLKLVEYATNSEAILVHVDVNLTRPINPDSSTDMSRADRDFAQFLQTYSAPPKETVADDAPPRRPLLILNRELQLNSEESDSCENPQPSFLAPYVNAGTGTVEWGTVQFDEDPDQKVRYWRLWERPCQINDAPYPSVQLLASLFLKQCRNQEAPCHLEPPADLSFEHSHRVSERVVYGIPWDPGNWPEVELNDRKVPIVQVIRAKDITEADPNKPLSTALLKDRIVVIGGTAEFERDMHSTPVGEMPGALIIINSIYSLNRFGRLREVPKVLEICLAIVLIGVASIFFAMLQHLWAYLFTAVVTVIAVLPLSLFAFHRGYWLDFAIPLLAVEAHHFIAQFEEAFEKKEGGESEKT